MPRTQAFGTTSERRWTSLLKASSCRDSRGRGELPNNRLERTGFAGRSTAPLGALERSPHDSLSLYYTGPTARAYRPTLLCRSLDRPGLHSVGSSAANLSRACCYLQGPL